MLFFAIYLIGMSKQERLDDKILQEILQEGLSCSVDAEFVMNDQMEKELKSKMMTDENYSDVLEKGAVKVINWIN